MKSARLLLYIFVLPLAVLAAYFLEKNGFFVLLSNRLTETAFNVGYLTPISFYGKVVDEKGTPVIGAVAEISVAEPTAPPVIEKITDSAGTFSIHSHGLGVSIVVTKDGYYSTAESNGSFDYATEEVNNPKGPNPKKRDRPAIFVLRKRGEIAELVKYHRQIKVPKDGTPVEVSFRTGENAVPAGKGDIKVESWIYNQGLRGCLKSKFKLVWRA